MTQGGTVERKNERVGWSCRAPAVPRVSRSLSWLRTAGGSNPPYKAHPPTSEDAAGIVHGFIKRTSKTPEADSELARKRMNEVQQ
jgi:hypothetical protein